SPESGVELGHQCAAASCGRDEGLWPLVIGMQVLVTNRLMRQRSKAVVVSDKEKAPHKASGVKQEDEQP
uniref:hypothetical protein n=1 Tax=Thiolapillus sp. TaxID=2017437 RepID=UPI003AF5B2ED